MKILKYTIIGISVMTLAACGSSERIIMEDGSVYEVKGSTILSKGKDVSEKLSDDRKDAISKALEEKKAAAKKAEKLKEELEKKQKSLEKAQEEAEDKQKELEEKLKEKEDAREDFLRAKDRLKDKTDKYNKLKKKGKLSPSDEEKWLETIEDLNKKLEEAQERYNKLR